MNNLHDLFPDNSASPTTDYPYGSARNITTSGDNTGTPFTASLQNDIIGNQQYLLQEAGITPNSTPDNATTSQQFESMWKIFNVRTFTKNITADADYTLTARENLKTRIVITDTTPLLITARNIILDNIPKLIMATNNTLQSLTFKTAAGSGIQLLSNQTKILYCDGANILDSNIITKTDFINTNQQLSANGYQKLPGGLIIQWGSAVTGSGGGVAITFPIAFTTAAYHISGSCDVVSVQPLILNFSTPTITSSAAYVSNGAGAGIGGIGIRYIVLGK